MKKHHLIPFTVLLLFFGSSAIANNTSTTNNGIEKSSQKKKTVKYEFSLFQIGYSLMKEKTDTVTIEITQKQTQTKEN
jgi:hypothetical protein